VEYSLLGPVFYEMVKIAELDRQSRLATETENDASTVAGTIEGDISEMGDLNPTHQAMSKKIGDKWLNFVDK
jgi:hypothetical protein